MDVTQEDSVPGAAANGPNPPINQRKLATQVAVQAARPYCSAASSRTIDDQPGAPFRAVFRFSANFSGILQKHDRTELIILILPRVVVNSEDAER